MLYRLPYPNFSRSIGDLVKLIKDLGLTIIKRHHLSGYPSLVLEPCYMKHLRIQTHDFAQFVDCPRSVYVALHELKVQVLVGFLNSFKDFGISQCEFSLLGFALYEGQVLFDELVKLSSLLLRLGAWDLD